MYETEWEAPIDPYDQDICEECGGDANDEGCEPWCMYYEATTQSDYSERMAERRQMGLCDF